MDVTALVATGIAGFLAGAVAWAAVLIACSRIRARNAQASLESAEQPQPSGYAEIDDLLDRLDDLARERNWDPRKLFDIAGMACENRTMTFDELERRYDQKKEIRA